MAAQNETSLEDFMREKLWELKERKPEPVTMTMVSRRSGIAQSVLHRFVYSDQGLHISTAEKLMRYMGITWRTTKKFRDL